MSTSTPGRHRAPRTPVTTRVATNVTRRVSSAAPGVVPALGAGALGATSLLSGGVAAAAPGGNAQAPLVAPRSHTYAPPADDDLAQLRGCEASGRYSTNTGNGFYGAYQFDIGTWRGLGLDGLPSEAAPDLQDAAASALEQDRGWQPWPACSARLGLVARRAHAVPPSTVVATFSTASATASTKGRHHDPSAVPTTPRPAHQTVQHAAKSRAAVPPFAGTVLTTRFASTYRSDVRLWQERMAERGWPITVDGYYGTQTASTALAFAQEKGLSVALPGEVDRAVWAAAWTAPIT